jgi:hypothetical protein
VCVCVCVSERERAWACVSVSVKMMIYTGATSWGFPFCSEHTSTGPWPFGGGEKRRGFVVESGTNCIRGWWSCGGVEVSRVQSTSSDCHRVGRNGSAGLNRAPRSLLGSLAGFAAGAKRFAYADG